MDTEQLFDDPEDEDASDDDQVEAEPDDAAAGSARHGDLYWEANATPLLAVIRARPTSVQTLKVQFARQLGNSQLVDEAITWLEQHGHIETFTNFKGMKCWRVPGAGDPEAPRPPRPAPRVITPMVAPRPAPAPKRMEPPTTPARSAAMATKEYVSTEEAAKILGVSAQRAMFFARTGEVKARKVADFVGRGHPPWEFLRSSLIKRQPNFMAEEETPPREPKKPREKKRAKVVALVPRKAAAPRQPAAIAAPPATDLGAHVRWVVDGFKLGRFSAEQALDQIVELVG